MRVNLPSSFFVISYCNYLFTRDIPCVNFIIYQSGRGAVWLARLPWEQEVPGSNPGAPTNLCPFLKVYLFWLKVMKKVGTVLIRNTSYLLYYVNIFILQSLAIFKYSSAVIISTPSIKSSSFNSIISTVILHATILTPSA